MGGDDSYLAKLAERGDLERVERGVYRLAGAPVLGAETMRTVSSRTPHAVVCLLSALAFHDIGTQSPNALWIAVAGKKWRPRFQGIRLEVVYKSAPQIGHGVQQHDIDGVKVKVTSPAQTVADCFKFRSRIGLDVAIEALRDTVRSRKATMDDIYEAAVRERMWNVMRPYTEML